LIKKYFETQKIDRKKLSDLESANIELQKSVLISRDVKQLVVTYLSGKKETITLLTEKIDVKNKNSSIIAELIPQSISSSNDLQFITEKQSMQSDIVLFAMQKPGKIIYYIRKEVAPLDTKKIITVAIDPFAESKKKGIGITGFAIFRPLIRLMIHCW
jgi:hypothetical protein